LILQVFRTIVKVLSFRVLSFRTALAVRNLLSFAVAMVRDVAKLLTLPVCQSLDQSLKVCHSERLLAVRNLLSSAVAPVAGAAPVSPHRIFQGATLETTDPDSRYFRCGGVAAVRTCRSGTECPAVPCKKGHGFTLSWTVRAERAPLRHNGPQRY
jgi:hypothetical protein